MRHLIGFNIFVIAFVGCAPQVSRIGYELSDLRKDPDCRVEIKKYATIDDELYERIGTINISDGKFSSNCAEDVIIDMLNEEACNIGADIVNITNSRQPSQLSKCYQVTADFYRSNHHTDTNNRPISADIQP